MNLSPKEILGSRHNVAKVTRFLRAADRVLDSLSKTSEGSKLSYGLAIAGAVGTVLDALVPEKAPHDQLLDMGYKSLSLSLGEFFCDLLSNSELPRSQYQLNASTALVTWDVGEGSVAAIYRNDAYEAGPYTTDGARELLSSAVCSVAWAQSSDLMLDAGQESNYSLQALGDPGVYFGVPKLEWFVERLKRHQGETRSMFLIGPTGVGKSTLGRLIARSVQDGKLLKVAARVIRNCCVTDLVEIAEFLQPDVLLLDDVVAMLNEHHEGGQNHTQMLELMEALHGKARLVIATLMMEPGQGGSGHRPARMRYVRSGGSVEPGSEYFNGMRPGRVDEVVRVKRPSPQVREQILLHYLGGGEGLAEHKITKKILKDIVERTEGLTGAYLKEVAHRIRVHGVKTYKGEIRSVSEAAPKLSPAARRAARGGGYRPRKRRKTTWEKRFDEAALKNEALTAKNEVLSLKLGVKPAKPNPPSSKPEPKRRRYPRRRR